MYRIAVGFYTLGAFDILGLLDAKVKPTDRAAWRAWIWEQQVRRPWHAGISARRFGDGVPSASSSASTSAFAAPAPSATLVGSMKPGQADDEDDDSEPITL